MTLEVGRPAPDFELRDQHGQTVTLSGFRGRTAVLLVFYPFVFSGVCTEELQALRDDRPDLRAGDAALLAVSCDPMFSLRAFADSDGIEFPLLSDFWPHGAVSSAYGVFDSRRGCPSRSSFVVDREGLVRWEMHNTLPEARAIGEYARVLAEL